MIKYKVFKVRSNALPEYMHEIDEDNPTFVGELEILETGLSMKVNGLTHVLITSQVKVVKETNEGYYVETNNSVYELRRERSCGCKGKCYTTHTK